MNLQTADCPKCQCRALPGNAACSRCGLLLSRFAGFVPPFEEGPPSLAAAWAGVEAAWDEEDAHARFLEQATALGALHHAAARYRGRLRRSGPDAWAEAGLMRAANLALRMQELQASGVRLDSLVRGFKMAAVSIGVFLAGATAWACWLIVSTKH